MEMSKKYNHTYFTAKCPKCGTISTAYEWNRIKEYHGFGNYILMDPPKPLEEGRDFICPTCHIMMASDDLQISWTDEDYYLRRITIYE